MFGFFNLHSRGWYEPVRTPDETDEENFDTLRCKQDTQRWKTVSIITLPYLIILVLTTIIFRLVFWPTGMLWTENIEDAKLSNLCPYVRPRLEWRQLTRSEQNQFIESVQCLYTKPSKLLDGDTLSDEFAWIHELTMRYEEHNYSPFLSWHRYIIYLHEKELRSCGFDGPMPYWDWTLDRDDLPKSIIWQSFGGNGNTELEEMKTRGYCVEDGPFAGYQHKYWLDRIYPHCLTRNFDLSGNGSGIESLRPESMDNLMTQKTVEDFIVALRDIHDVIPSFIGGDFYWGTSLYDPVFILHHGQLDRLWWLWQQRHPQQMRVFSRAVIGRDIEVLATTHELAPMFGIPPEVLLSTMENAESEPLCYRY